jgi:hypothetical protein
MLSVPKTGTAPKAEVDALMELLVNTLASEVGELHENGVRLNAIGDLGQPADGMPGTALKKAMDHTAGNNRITLTLALSYSARWDILRMVRGVANDIKEGRIGMHDIDEKAIGEQRLSTGRYPASGTAGAHQRRSTASATSCFGRSPTPNSGSRPCSGRISGKEHLYQAVLDFQHRERRFRPHPRTAARPAMTAMRATAPPCLAFLSRACRAPAFPPQAQGLGVPTSDYGYPKEYTIAGITVSGCVTRDPNAVKLFSGLKVGDKSDHSRR